MGLKRYVIQRVLLAIPVIFILLTSIFILIHVIPGDPADAILGANAPEEAKAQLRREYGLDRPLHIQYFDYMTGLIRGDLGKALYSWQVKSITVSSIISERLPVTIQLAVLSWILIFLVGLVTGIYSSMKEGQLIDHVARGVFLFFYSTPLFVIGTFLQLMLGVYVRAFPLAGMFSEIYRLTPNLLSLLGSKTHLKLCFLGLQCQYLHPLTEKKADWNALFCSTLFQCGNRYKIFF